MKHPVTLLIALTLTSLACVPATCEWTTSRWRFAESYQTFQSPNGMPGPMPTQTIPLLTATLNASCSSGAAGNGCMGYPAWGVWSWSTSWTGYTTYTYIASGTSQPVIQSCGSNATAIVFQIQPVYSDGNYVLYCEFCDPQGNIIRRGAHWFRISGGQFAP